MTVLETIPEAAATGEVARHYEADLADYGYVADYTKVMALNMEALDAFETLAKAVARGLGLRRYELVTLAAARALRSRHCLLAHARKSSALFSEAELVRIARDYRDAGLSPAEVAMMEFAERLSGDAAAMGEDDAARLREHGFSDREILDITLAAALRNYYSRALQALGVDLQVPPGISEELREALLHRT